MPTAKEMLESLDIHQLSADYWGVDMESDDRATAEYRERAEYGASTAQELLGTFKEIMTLACKETSRNVRHRAAELALLGKEGEIMNIQFKDVDPFK